MYAATHTDFNTSIFQGLFSFSLKDYVVDKSKQIIKKKFQEANLEATKIRDIIEYLHPLQIVGLKRELQGILDIKEEISDFILNPEISRLFNIQQEAFDFVRLLNQIDEKIEKKIEDNLGLLHSLTQEDNIWDSEEDQHWDNY